MGLEKLEMKGESLEEDRSRSLGMTRRADDSAKRESNQALLRLDGA
jgi:hypothetical protein